ncbi:hypothetical protein K6I34_006026 [Streptomyces sp. UNOC14_S4]|nr:AEC family transporter [Streptomyces sp. UNOC14_S4]MCC3767670.1 hypothetical protein [Streptomyces sp. UNOC14_S4]
MTALGWAAGRFRTLGPHAQPVLGRFAFTFAMPALLFLTLSTTPVGEIADPGVAAFASGLLAVFGAGLLLSGTVLRMRPADRAWY